MKWFLAVLLIVATQASCRSSQPATNPFLRTTVPPPGAPGVVVTPGQPYAQGIAPPMITSPAPPPFDPATMNPQAVPATAAPPIAPMAPPPTMPQGEKFRYPGGSYLFHQSSIERPSQAEVVRVAKIILPDDPAEKTPVVRTAQMQIEIIPPTHMTADGVIENPYVKAKQKAQAASQASQPPASQAPPARATAPSPPPPAAPQLPQRPTQSPAPRTNQATTQTNGTRSLPPAKQAPGTARPPSRLPQTSATRQARPVAREPQTAPAAVATIPSRVSVQAIPQQNSLRILGEAKHVAQATHTTDQAKSASPAVANQAPRQKPQHVAAPATPVLRITAGPSQPTLRSTLPSEEQGESNVAIVAKPEEPRSTTFTPVADNPTYGVQQATFQPTQSTPPANSAARYFHSPDYSQLSGKLEYSASQGQWKLRYIPIDGQTDRFGGSVILGNVPKNADLKAGDWVQVQGQITGANQSPTGFAPSYQSRTIKRLAR